MRYEAVNAMLLNQFLKEHRKVEEQQATITELKKELQANATRQQKQIEALTATLQKVSAQLEASKFAIGRIRMASWARSHRRHVSKQILQIWLQPARLCCLCAR